ncbi:MAG: SGNH/GDSL hydrolase family protein [Deltaproteobacteria bacterium]|nr:SGNH/GDSL hydrolase family protein [Deltaproteobacteria bacterium]
MKRRLFAAAAVVLVLFAAEAVCRLLLPGVADTALYMRFSNPHREQSGFIPDDNLFWRLAPNNDEWQVNALGYRGPAVPEKKPAGEFRIVALGDSCTFGLGEGGVPYEDTYPSVLEDLLKNNAKGLRVRALNFGCPGYTSFQGKRLLASEALRFQPDVVTAYFGINDGFEAVGFTDAEQRPVDLNAAPLKNILRHSALYTALTRGVVGARREHAPGGEGFLERVPIDEYHRNLDEIARLAASAGAPTYFIPPVYLGDAEPGREDHRIHRPVIDIFPEIQAAHRRGVSVIFGGDDRVHPTPAGHAIIAKAIADRLRHDFGL